MNFATFLLLTSASVILGASIVRGPRENVMRRTPEVESQGVSGQDADDAIAYAWFAEDDDKWE
ncbi:hypothetical protein GGR57DRAFT_503117 [Xylariaceae sp. FL1272]|nr:hypothetical protein GGR57DRAFT_503117 [Xylariaceae sp. FL1272]